MNDAAGVQTGRDLQAVRRMFSGDHARWWRELYAGPPRTAEESFFRQRRDVACEQIAERVPHDVPVLDLGCGAAPVLVRLRRGPWHCTGLDGSAEMLAQARRRLVEAGLHAGDLHLGDARQVPFADQAFGAVVCLGVISYVEDHPAVLAEIHRVLRPGGLAWVSCRSAEAPVIWDPWQWARRAARAALRRPPRREVFTPGRFMRPAEVRADLAAAGLQVVEEMGIGFGPPRWAGKPWWPTALALRLDKALSGLTSGALDPRGGAARTLRRAADIQLWVVQRPQEVGP
jgi:SAM-dependent methyltransferase